MNLTRFCCWLLLKRVLRHDYLFPSCWLRARSTWNATAINPEQARPNEKASGCIMNCAEKKRDEKSSPLEKKTRAHPSSTVVIVFWFVCLFCRLALVYSRHAARFQLISMHGRVAGIGSTWMHDGYLRIYAMLSELIAAFIFFIHFQLCCIKRGRLFFNWLLIMV